MDYNVKDTILKSLVNVLKPPKKLEKLENNDRNFRDSFVNFYINILNFNPKRFYFFFQEKDNETLVDFVQQAASAKTIGILVKLSNQISEQFLSVYFKFR